MRTCYWEDDCLHMIDQRLLPGELEIARFDTVDGVARDELLGLGRERLGLGRVVGGLGLGQQRAHLGDDRVAGQERVSVTGAVGRAGRHPLAGRRPDARQGMQRRDPPQFAQAHGR